MKWTNNSDMVIPSDDANLRIAFSVIAIDSISRFSGCSANSYFFGKSSFVSLSCLATPLTRAMKA
jgi:hypothetical protein